MRTLLLIFALLGSIAHAQQISAPEPQAGTIAGTAVDIVDAAIPGATVSLEDGTPADNQTTTTDISGGFQFNNVRSANKYHLKVKAAGFDDWNSPDIMLTPGQQFTLSGVKLKVATLVDSVSAETPEQLAIEQVEVEEKQRIFGAIPNFYVVYSHNPAPLSKKLKYKLAYRALIDPVNLVASSFLAGIQQAADTPGYVQGAKGYGQRIGANYADGVTDVLLGGAILPSLLHQDPRYYYSGEGTKKRRFVHAISAPFVCKNDQGHSEINYSSIGGDLGSGAISELYYPQSDRGVGLVFTNAAITTGGRMLNALAQEFLLKKFTTKPKVTQ